MRLAAAEKKGGDDKPDKPDKPGSFGISGGSSGGTTKTVTSSASCSSSASGFSKVDNDNAMATASAPPAPKLRFPTALHTYMEINPSMSAQ